LLLWNKSFATGLTVPCTIGFRFLYGNSNYPHEPRCISETLRYINYSVMKSAYVAQKSQKLCHNVPGKRVTHPTNFLHVHKRTTQQPFGALYIYCCCGLHSHAFAASALHLTLNCHPTLIPVSRSSGFTLIALVLISMTPRCLQKHLEVFVFSICKHLDV
jgi:hypothetical protein